MSINQARDNRLTRAIDRFSRAEVRQRIFLGSNKKYVIILDGENNTVRKFILTDTELEDWREQIESGEFDGNTDRDVDDG